ncbi:MAG: universal stress protein [Desulfatiglandales bacterium]
MEIKKLLYATDFEEPDFAQVESLLVFRKVGLEEVIFLHTSGLEDWGKRVVDHGLKSRTLAGEGPLLSRILDATQKEKISIVAVNMKREGKKVFSGSPVKNLLRSSSVPLIVMNQDAQTYASGEKGIFNHVVFAADWSPVSEAILKALLNFGEITEMLEIVNVINKKLSVRDIRNLKMKLVETRKKFLDKGIDAEAHVYAGKPAEEIMLAATDYKATSIIMGTSNKSSFEGLFSRSCSYGVAKEAAVPILFIPFEKGV